MKNWIGSSSIYCIIVTLDGEINVLNFERTMFKCQDKVEYGECDEMENLLGDYVSADSANYEIFNHLFTTLGALDHDDVFQLL